MSYYNRKKSIKKFHKNCDLKNSSRPFDVCKESNTISIGKQNFCSKLLILCISKTIKICPCQDADLLSFLFTKDSLKIKKGLERAFEVKQKTFFLVSKVLSLRHTKQTSKNLAKTTFKVLFLLI